MIYENSETIFPIQEEMKVLPSKNYGQTLFVDLTVISFTIW